MQYPKPPCTLSAPAATSACAASSFPLVAHHRRGVRPSWGSRQARRHAGTDRHARGEASAVRNDKDAESQIDQTSTRSTVRQGGSCSTSAKAAWRMQSHREGGLASMCLSTPLQTLFLALRWPLCVLALRRPLCVLALSWPLCVSALRWPTCVLALPYLVLGLLLRPCVQ